MYVRARTCWGEPALLLWVRTTARWAAARLGVDDERAASAVEYAILIGLIAAVLVGAVYFLGRSTSTSFRCVNVERPNC